MLKPLCGSDDEMITVFAPVLQPFDKLEDDQFELPDKSDLDSFLTAKLLYDAARLSFRQVSGSFRCMGKLSFRPRSYQLVPLIMALKQPVTRLLVADDVGVGKTIEALLILRELIERGTIKTFAVLCPPATGFEMLQRRKSKIFENGEITDDEVRDNPIVEKWDEQSDTEQIEIIERADLTENEWNTLSRLAQKAAELINIEKDYKVRRGLEQVKLWINKGQSPIIFCRFIATAQYVAKILKDHLPKDVDVRAITSELCDEERREKIDEMAKSPVW